MLWFDSLMSAPLIALSIHLISAYSSVSNAVCFIYSTNPNESFPVHVCGWHLGNNMDLGRGNCKQHETCSLWFLSVVSSAANENTSWMIRLWSKATELDPRVVQSVVQYILITFHLRVEYIHSKLCRSSLARNDWNYLKFNDFSQPLGMFMRTFFLGKFSLVICIDIFHIKHLK